MASEHTPKLFGQPMARVDESLARDPTWEIKIAGVTACVRLHDGTWYAELPALVTPAISRKSHLAATKGLERQLSAIADIINTVRDA